MKTVAILVLDGMFDSAIALSRNLFATANEIAAYEGQGRVNIIHCGVRRGAVNLRDGLMAKVDIEIAQLDTIDVLVVPGLGLTTEADVEHYLSRPDVAIVQQEIRRLHRQAVLIAASCSGVFLLAETGLLEQKAVTVNWFLVEIFKRRYPKLSIDTNQIMSRHPGLICAGAAMAHADLMMSLIGRLFGPAIARSTGRFMLVEERRSQAPFALSSLVRERHSVAIAAEKWIRRHLKESISVRDLASASNLSQRTLDRRLKAATGMSPIQFIRKIRLETALHLLQTSDQSVEHIAAEVGYDNASSLRRLISRETGRSAQHYRQSA